MDHHHTVIELLGSGRVEEEEEVLDRQRLISGVDDDHNYKQQVYLNKLSAREMESLIAITDTFLPSVEAPDDEEDGHDVDKFYRTCASMAGTPHLVSTNG